MMAGSEEPFYLGLGSRFEAGPSELMVALGFRSETAQAGLLHQWLGLADLTHVLALTESGSIPPPSAGRLLAALLSLQEQDPATMGYDRRDGDAYNGRERILREMLGADAGWLSLGRTRREAGRQAFGLACRRRLLGAHEDTASLVAVLATLAEQHRHTWWADQTYWLPAQVSSLGHYLLSFGFEAVRHLDRIEAAWQRWSLVPLAAGGVAGTRVPIRPEQYRTRLGLEGPTTTTRDAMWSVDGLVDVAAVSQHLTLTATRLAEDLLVFATEQFGWVRLDDAHCRASVYLPQKRNPYALTSIRGAHGIVSGRLAGVVTSLHTGSAQTDNWIYNYGEVADSLDVARRVVRLLSQVLERADFDRERLAASALDGFTDAADLAERLALGDATDYRHAHELVATRVADAERHGLRRLSDAADLAEMVQARHGAGGAADEDMAAALGELRRRLAQADAWRHGALDSAATAERELIAEAEAAAARLSGSSQ